MNLAAILSPITQAAYLALLMAFHLANGVPVASWTSPRNPGLSLTQICAQLLAALSAQLSTAIQGLFLDTSAGNYLTLFAKSQYQLTRTPAQFTSGQVLLTCVTGGPAYTFSAGQITLGTPGPSTTASQFYQNSESGTLQPGYLYIPLGGNGLQVQEKTTGVNFTIVVSGTNTLLSVSAGSSPPGGSIVVYQSADANGNPTSTATQVAAKINANGTAAGLVTPTVLGTGLSVPGALPTVLLDAGALSLGFTAQLAGAAGNIPTGSVVNLKTSFAGVSAALVAWSQGTWITSQGNDPQPDPALSLLCRNRWGTLGVGGNNDAFSFWAMQIPNGYTASPVSQVQVLPNFFDGVLIGGTATVAVVGPAGALGSGDVAAVQANFDSPITNLGQVVANGQTYQIPGLNTLGKKYPIGCQVSVVTATNNPIVLTGTVYYSLSSGVSAGAIQTAVQAAITAYQQTLTMNQTVYPQEKIAGVIGQAAPYASAITQVDLSGMPTQITSTILQIPELTLTGLSYVGV